MDTIPQTHHTYRAAYWISGDQQGSLVLTLLEQSGLSDDDLMAAANECATEQWLQGGTIEIGDWTE